VAVQIQGTGNINIFRPNSVELGQAELLFSEILKRKPDFKTPDIQKWAESIDQMIRLDKRNMTVLSWSML